MFEIKAIRASKPVTDPSDPLSLENTKQADPRLLPALAGGIVGLALYLKSFLAAGPVTAAVIAPEHPENDPDAEASTAGPGLRVMKPRIEAAGNDNRSQPASKDFPAADGLEPVKPVFSPYESLLALSGSGGLRWNSPPLALIEGAPVANASPGSRFAPKAGMATQSPAGQSIASGPSTARREGGAGAEAETGSAPAAQDRNRAPRNSGPVTLGEIGSGTAIALALAHLLSRSSDQDGDKLGITMVGASAGSLSSTGNGWTYVADPEQLGDVTLTYIVGDGLTGVIQNAVFTVIENQIDGTDASELLIGTQGRDVITGLDGNDHLAGLAGRDTIDGGKGDDAIAGGSGDDLLSGGEGNDVIAGNEGNDVIHGGNGNDRLSGDAGNDRLHGDAGDDEIDGGEGDDFLSGGDGNDRLAGGTGSDTILAGAGDDVVIADDDGVADHHDGGEGQDLIDYSAATQGVEIDLAAGTASGVSVGEDTFTGFETFVGSSSSDTFCASDGQANLTGNGGEDLYRFLPGDTVDVPGSRYAISDFDDDDRIEFATLADAYSGGLRISKVQKSVEERIDDFFDDFAEAVGADQPRIRYAHEWTEDYCRTIVEVDFDRDETMDITLTLDGEHILALVSDTA